MCQHTIDSGELCFMLHISVLGVCLSGHVVAGTVVCFFPGTVVSLYLYVCVQLAFVFVTSNLMDTSNYLDMHFFLPLIHSDMSAV